MKKIYRSKRDKIIGGVCGGIGEYFDIDPLLVRLLWIAFIFAGGAGVLAYIIAWIIIPLNPKNQDVEAKEVDDKNKMIGGVILIIFGVIFIFVNFGAFTFAIVWKSWPLILIALGLILLGKSLRK